LYVAAWSHARWQGGSPASIDLVHASDDLPHGALGTRKNTGGGGQRALEEQVRAIE
jgi:hypothetical protein